MSGRIYGCALRTTRRALRLVALCSIFACDTNTVELGGRQLLDAALADASADGAAVDDDADLEDRDDADEQNEEGHTDLPRPCTTSAQCSGEERLCNVARSVCVECLRDADCKPSERCEGDGECEGPE